MVNSHANPFLSYIFEWWNEFKQRRCAIVENQYENFKIVCLPPFKSPYTPSVIGTHPLVTVICAFKLPCAQWYSQALNVKRLSSGPK